MFEIHNPSKLEKSVEIFVPADVRVIMEKRRKIPSIAFPFRFLDGDQAIITITYLEPRAWKPTDYIESILIKLK